MLTAFIAVTGATTAIPASVAYGQITTEETATKSLVNDYSGTEAAVRAYFDDIPVMVAVARCESTFRHTLSDGSVLRGRVDSADTGVMQINKRYHEDRADQLGLDLDNLYDNMAYARYLYEKQGTQPWNASRPCWGKTLAYNN